ncbi:putative retroelement [Abeliophyllum distichum]|uniref:Retroelement n=1 Tax=Abeliophyllum distichum TaxID=126358 RepID=A0ABD1V4C3_9LAMI
MQDQLAFRIQPVIRPAYKKPYPNWVDQAYPWPRGYKVPEFSLFTSLGEVSTLEHDTIESGRITFESKKKMVVDNDPFPQLIDINMVIPNLDKFGFLRFKLVVDNGEDELHPNIFENLKGKVVIREEMNLCARCQKKVGNITERMGVYEQQIQLANATNFHPFRGQVKPFYGRVGRMIPFNEMTRTQQRRFQRNYGQMMGQQKGAEHSRATIERKVVNKNVLENGDEEDTKASKDEPLKGECVGKSKFEHRKKDEDDDDAGQLITIQFGTTMPPVMLITIYWPMNLRIKNMMKR